MKKILITRKLIKDSEDKAQKLLIQYLIVMMNYTLNQRLLK
jgi:hypothetical protein